MVSFKKIKYCYQGKFDPLKLEPTNIDWLSTALVPENSKVLELGCATGFMSQYFRRRLHCQVIGVDINPNVKPDITGDLNLPATWAKIKKFKPFDVVFASAIIEHLPNPEATLQLIKAVLKPQGQLIITAPNVAHWRLRLKLLRGHWDYEDYGLLDKTHLRFFTYYSFQKLISDAGFKIKQVLLDPAGGVKYFNWLFKYFPNFYAHQICIKAVNH
jgi:SAM-dependent methyltransferase